MSNIFIFNLSANPIVVLHINGNPINVGTTAISAANPLPGWSTTAAKHYQPNGAPVSRSPDSPTSSGNIGKPVFSQKTPNEVFVEWGVSNQTSQFRVDMQKLPTPNDPLNEDFLLYIAIKQSVLFDEYGTAQAYYPPPVEGKKTPAEE